MPRAALLVLVGAGLALIGCGNDRTPVPDTARAARPVGEPQRVAVPDAGIELRAPGNWRVASDPVAPLVAEVSSGRAVVSVWRYPRAEPLPDGSRLDRARRDLIAAARKRSGSLEIVRAASVEVDGAPAVVLVADQRIAGRKRRVRSVHVYAYGTEVVVDGLAPPGGFARVDRAVFRPLLRSLRLAEPGAG